MEVKTGNCFEQKSLISLPIWVMLRTGHKHGEETTSCHRANVENLQHFQCPGVVNISWGVFVLTDVRHVLYVFTDDKWARPGRAFLFTGKTEEDNFDVLKRMDSSRQFSHTHRSKSSKNVELISTYFPFQHELTLSLSLSVCLIWRGEKWLLLNNSKLKVTNVGAIW